MILLDDLNTDIEKQLADASRTVDFPTEKPKVREEMQRLQSSRYTALRRLQLAVRALNDVNLACAPSKSGGVKKGTVDKVLSITTDVFQVME